MADAREGLPAKAVRPQLGQVRKFLDLARSEPFAQNWQVCFLKTAEQDASGEMRARSVGKASHLWLGAMGGLLTLMPDPLSCICSSLTPPSLTVTLILVAPASSEFSINSLSALAGRWII